MFCGKLKGPMLTYTKSQPNFDNRPNFHMFMFELNVKHYWKQVAFQPPIAHCLSINSNAENRKPRCLLANQFLLTFGLGLKTLTKK